MTVLQQHPLSAAFPPLSDEEFQTLKDSIENLGVQNAITIYEGQVLDGWNRYCAAQELGFECPTREIDGHIDPREFVLAQNKARRHVTQAQLALATTAVFEWRPVGSNQHGGSALSAEAPKSTKELAEAAGVGVRTIEQAKAVQSSAVPEVVEAVRSGAMGLTKAAAIAKLPQEEQAQAIEKPMRQTKPAPAPAPAMPPLENEPEQSPKAREATKPPKAAEPDKPTDEQLLRDEVASLRDELAVAREEAKSLAEIVDSGDQLAAALAEGSKSRELARGLQTRVNSLLTENAQLKRDVRYWQRKAESDK